MYYINENEPFSLKEFVYLLNGAANKFLNEHIYYTYNHFYFINKVIVYDDDNIVIVCNSLDKSLKRKNEHQLDMVFDYDFYGAQRGTRTLMAANRWILSPLRLPFRHLSMQLL